MNTLEAILLYIWIIGIVIVQFDHAARRFVMKFDFLGYFPSFHLFSPHPFIGRYRIKYHVIYDDDCHTSIREEEIHYMGRSDPFDANQKVIKGINNLCRSAITRPVMKNAYFMLLTNYIKNNAKKKFRSGRLQFFIFLTIGIKEELKFKSRFYDL